MRTSARRQPEPRRESLNFPAPLARRANAAPDARSPLHANAASRAAESRAPSLNRFAHDFSRVPVSGEAPARPQFKLKVGAPGDAYEREAAGAAERVMRSAETRPPSACECGGGGCDACRGESVVRRSRAEGFGAYD